MFKRKNLTGTERRGCFLVKTWGGGGAAVRMELWLPPLFLSLTHVLSEDRHCPFVYSWNTHGHITKDAHRRGCWVHAWTAIPASILLLPFLEQGHWPPSSYITSPSRSANKGFQTTSVSFQSRPSIWWPFKATLSQLILLVSEAMS